jgi:hypothetical protein
MQFLSNILSEEIDLRWFSGCLEDLGDSPVLTANSCCRSGSYFGAIKDDGNEFLQIWGTKLSLRLGLGIVLEEADPEEVVDVGA